MQAATLAPQATPPADRSAPTATEMYEAAKLVQRELIDQRDQLVRARRTLRGELEDATNPVVVKGIETRLVATDGRLADVEKQLAAAETQVANRAAIPGVVIQPAPRNEPDIPPEAVVLGGLGMAMVLMLPISIGWARRIWRRGAAVPVAQLPTELTDRMGSIERAIEGVAIEVERLGESQRFVAQLLDTQSKRALGAAMRVDGGAS